MFPANDVVASVNQMAQIVLAVSYNIDCEATTWYIKIRR